MSTYATMEINADAFQDIQRQLRAAGYGYTADFKLGDTPTIVMEGFAVQPRLAAETQPVEQVPSDVLQAAKSMKDNDYRGPLAWAKKVIDWVAAQPHSPEPQPVEEREPARWCWFHDGDERVPVLTSEEEAHAEAQQWIDDNCEPGELHDYLVAPMKSGIDLLPSAQHIGESVCESINEGLSDEMGAEDDPIDFSAEDRIKLGGLVREFIQQAGSEQWWTVDTKKQVKHTYVAGSNANDPTLEGAAA